MTVLGRWNEQRIPRVCVYSLIRRGAGGKLRTRRARVYTTEQDRLANFVQL